MPSITAHMGLEGFSTQKLVWGSGAPIYNEDGTVSKPYPDDKLPRMDLGKWIGPDGNYLIASFLCGDYIYHFESNDDTRPLHEREEYLKAIEHNERYTGVPARMMYYGVGDFGGSPSEDSVHFVNDAVDKNSENESFRSAFSYERADNA